MTRIRAVEGKLAAVEARAEAAHRVKDGSRSRLAGDPIARKAGPAVRPKDISAIAEVPKGIHPPLDLATMWSYWNK